MAYYAVFSIVPLIVVSLAVAVALFGQQAAEGALRQQLEAFIVEDGAREVEDLVARAHRPGKSLLAGVAGTGALIFAASGLFSQLQGALNVIGKSPSAGPTGVLGMLRERFWSFVVVLLAGGVLLFHTALTTAVDAAGQWSASMAPQLAMFWRLFDGFISWGVGVAVFAITFKFLPEAKVAWRDVWTGAVVTAVLFTAGKSVFGFYLRWVSFDTMYGPAGALIVVLVWAYYSAQIVLLGAEVTNACAMPSKNP
jgi:membrane protein